MRISHSSRLRRWRQQVVGLRARSLRSPAEESVSAAAIARDCLSVCDGMLEELAASEEECLRLRRIASDERERWERLFEALPVACVLTDAAGVIVGANRAAALLLNVACSRLRGQVLLYFAIDRAQLFDALAARGAEPGPARMHLRIRPREKATIEVEALVMDHPESGTEGQLWFLMPSTSARQIREMTSVQQSGAMGGLEPHVLRKDVT
jgi:PAS domain-containing protein